MTEPERPDPPMTGDERAQLNGFLDFLRATVVWKASGLTDEQARATHVPSELTTIAGLVGHLALVEGYWFREILDGQASKWDEALAEDPDAEFRVALKTPIADVIAEYEAECEAARKIVAGMDLEDTVPFKDRQVSVRWVLIHMIEETGRHAGHLDLLRELTDGVKGE